MPDRFYDGQRGPDIRRELNNLEAVFDDAIANAKGPKGWSPELAVVADGTRRVFQVIDWIGGEGDKPTDLGYIGVAGIVPNIADAIDVRGTQGIQGIQGDQGVKGDTGDAGTNGTNGTNGLDGADGTDGLDGENGWSPVLSNIIDGARAVQQVTDWVGGTGTKPVTDKYIGATGLVDDIADAVNIRGASGAGTGDVMGPASSANNAVALFDGTTGKILKDGGLLGTAAFEDIADFASAAEGDLAMTAVQPGDLATVGTTGDYNDLSNKPSIPAAQQQTDWDATSGITSIANKPAVIAAGADAAAARAVIGALGDAPSDGKTYGRKDAAWAEVVSEAVAIGDTITTARLLTAPTWLPCDASVYLQSSYTSLYALLGILLTPGQDKLPNPATLPAGAGTGCAWDAAGTYLAVAHSTTPFVSVYSRSGTTLTKLANPATLPTGIGFGCAWDAAGTYLAVAHSTTPFLSVYERSGTTLTKLPNPATLPAGTGRGCAWDASGTYLAVALQAAPYLAIYSRSGATLTKLADPATLPTGNAYGCSWDDSGTYLSFAHEVAPFVTTYSRSGTTFTKLPNPATLPTGIGFGCAWDAAGTYLAVAHSTTPFVSVYSRSGTTLTKLPNPPALPPGNTTGCSWNGAGRYLSVSHSASPYVTIYERGAGYLNKLATPSVLPGASGIGCAFTASGAYLAVASSNTPFVTAYQNLNYDPATQFQVPPATYPSGLVQYIRSSV